MEYNEIEKDVKNILSEKRFKHSIGVVKRAIEFAKIYNIDEETVKKVAIAHDCAKELSAEEALNYAKQNNIEIDEVEQLEPGLLHAKIGADIARKKYNFSKEMINAILYHTIGDINMDTLAKIIYIADKTEEGRVHIDKETAVNLAIQNLDEGVLFVSKYMIEHSLKKNSLIHPNTIQLINKIIKEKRG